MDNTSTVLDIAIVDILTQCTLATVDNLPIILVKDSECKYMSPHYRKRLPKEAKALKELMKSDTIYATILTQEFKLLSVFFASVVSESAFAAGDTERDNPVIDDWIHRINSCIHNSLDTEMRQKLELINYRLQVMERLYANTKNIQSLAKETLEELENMKNGKEDA